MQILINLEGINQTVSSNDSRSMGGKQLCKLMRRLFNPIVSQAALVIVTFQFYILGPTLNHFHSMEEKGRTHNLANFSKIWSF